MRPILLGPFGSMGSLWLKLRVICIEDMFIEGLLSFLNIARVMYAEQDHEVWSAWASFIGSTLVFLTTSILVLDGGFQCCLCRRTPLCTWLCCFGSGILNWLSDKHLMRLFFITSQLGIAMGLVGIFSECMTLANASEAEETAIQVPVQIGNKESVQVTERDQAILMILLQIFVSIPWRLYTMKVSKGVLDAIHCSEELDFRSTYGADALRMLLPRTGLINDVDLAHKSDIPALAQLQYEAFQQKYNYLGITDKNGPLFIESQLKSKGRAVVKKWLGRVGVVRDATGAVQAALNLQLPGDTAAYEACAIEPDSYHDNNNYLIYSSSSKSIFDCKLNWNKFGLSDSSGTGPLKLFRYRFKAAILNDHVCTPGEAYIEFLCTKEEARRTGAAGRLLKWAEQSSETLGCGRITLKVNGSNHYAIALYEKYGYRITRDYRDCCSSIISKLLFGTSNGYLTMEKPLGQEQGHAVYSNLFGFSSNRNYENNFQDSLSIHAATFALLSGHSTTTHDISSLHGNPIFRNKDFNESEHNPVEAFDTSSHSTSIYERPASSVLGSEALRMPGQLVGIRPLRKSYLKSYINGTRLNMIDRQLNTSNNSNGHHDNNNSSSGEIALHTSYSTSSLQDSEIESSDSTSFQDTIGMLLRKQESTENEYKDTSSQQSESDNDNISSISQSLNSIEQEESKNSYTQLTDNNTIPDMKTLKNSPSTESPSSPSISSTNTTTIKIENNQLVNNITDTSASAIKYYHSNNSHRKKKKIEYLKIGTE